MADIPGWFYDRDAEPDFKPIVEKSLSLFAVFTGVVFSFYVKDFVFGPDDPKILHNFAGFSFCSKIFVAVTVTTLLLRYIVGSAAHLNARYLPKTTLCLEGSVATDPNGGVFQAGRDVYPRKMALREDKVITEKRLGWLYFDIGVLVAFGGLAIYLTFAPSLEDLMRRCLYFVAAGFLWGVIAQFRCADRYLARRWIIIDGAQSAVTLLLIWQHDVLGVLPTTAVLAAVYMFCLVVDFAVVSRPKYKDVCGKRWCW
jgi:cytochrome b subunit of formate dehydrogenase